MIIISSEEWKICKINKEDEKFEFYHVKDTNNALSVRECKFIYKPDNVCLIMKFTQGRSVCKFSDRALLRLGSQAKTEMDLILEYFQETCSTVAVKEMKVYTSI